MEADEVIRAVERNLRFYGSRFVNLDEMISDINEEIKRYAKLNCYYYVAEEPIVDDVIIDEQHNTVIRIERAYDDVRCITNDHEVSVAYVKIARAVVEVPSGQYWLILSYEVNRVVNDE
jgi:septation ring formation regulator EzrA